MIFRQALAILLLALGLGACATYPDYGVRYEDGSYYSPADEGRGDYYYAPEPRYDRYYHDDYDWFFGSPFYGPGHFGSWYGSPFYRYDGYCSVRYRYCPRFGYYDSFPRFGLSLQFGDPWYYDRYYYDRYRHGYGERWAPPPRRSRPPPAQPIGESQDDPSRSWAPRDQDAMRREFRRARPDPRDDLRRDGEAVADPDAPAARWRRVPSRPSSSPPPPPRYQAPPPPPRTRSSDGGDDADTPRRRDADDRN